MKSLTNKIFIQSQSVQNSNYKKRRENFTMLKAGRQHLTSN